jgi:hypothetical protein
MCYQRTSAEKLCVKNLVFCMRYLKYKYKYMKIIFYVLFDKSNLELLYKEKSSEKSDCR